MRFGFADASEEAACMCLRLKFLEISSAFGRYVNIELTPEKAVFSQVLCIVVHDVIKRVVAQSALIVTDITVASDSMIFVGFH